jgi:hypothetical protein
MLAKHMGYNSFGDFSVILFQDADELFETD